MSSPSILRDLQEAVTAHLRGCSSLSGLEIHDRRTGEIEHAIQQALAAIGLTLFVSPVYPRGFSPNLPAPVFSRADITVRIIEAPATNQGDRDVYAVAETVMRRLHQWQPGVEGAGCLLLDENPLDDSASDDSRVIFDVLFHLSGSMEAGAD